MVSLISQPFSSVSLTEERLELLRFMADLLETPRVFLFQWLFDSGASGPEIRLDQVYAKELDKGGASIGVVARGLEGCHLCLGDADAADMDKLHGRLSFRGNAVIGGWLAGKGADVTALAEEFLPLESHDPEKAGKPLGVIQIVMPHRSESLPEACRALVTAIAGKIENSRNHRIWNALSELNSLEGGRGDIDATLKAAAAIVRRDTRAALCTISYPHISQASGVVAYSAPHPPKLRVPPIENNPFLRQVWQNRKSVRVRDRLDVAEMETLFGPTPSGFQSVLRPGHRLSWMCVPVLVDAVGLEPDKSEKGVICLIQAFKKNPLSRVYTAFSETDQKMVEKIAEALSNIVPVATLQGALQGIARRLAEIGTSDNFEPRVAFDLLAETIPETQFSAIVDADGQVTLSDARFQTLEDDLRRTVHWPDGVANLPNGQAVLIQKLFDIDNRKAVMAVGIMDPWLPGYKRDIVRYLCREVARFLSDKHHMKSKVEDLIQIRHNVRSGLQGMIGHMTVANTRWRNFKDRDPSLAFRRLVDSARFHKSLARARLFAEKTRILVDESRFILDRIAPESLKVIDCDILDLIAEVTLCLRPEAERRGLDIIVNGHMLPKPSRTGKMDRDLVYILLFNIIENAVKYSYRDQIVQIDVKPYRAGGWAIAVSNVGDHIPEEQREAIFEPFRRLHAANPDARRPGTGLGVAVARKILQAHDSQARIEIQSTLRGRTGTDGALTVFTIFLPKAPRYL
ncbi:MAG: GAF domain-containing sensor histidine kinase [Magnetospirillum sp. WYHS-4]